MLGVLREGHKQSVYAEAGEIDEKEAYSLLVNVIQRHNARGKAGTWVQVIDAGSSLEGLIVGVLQPVYQIGTRCTATDLFWLGSRRASAREKIGLMWSLTEWAKGHKHAYDIVCTGSGAFPDPERAHRILEHLGFERFGGLWRMKA